MKRTITLLLLLTLNFTTWGQSQFEIAFGTQYEAVWSFISAKGFINAKKTDDQTISAQNGTMEVNYHFWNGRLYQIETRKYFENKNESIESFEGLRKYLGHRNARIRNISEDKNIPTFVAEMREIVCEVQHLREGKSFAVHQTHTQPQLSPAFGQFAQAEVTAGR